MTYAMPLVSDTCTLAVHVHVHVRCHIVSYNVYSILLTAPTAPPTIGSVRRISATDIEVDWEALSPEESVGVVTSYLVRYRITDDGLSSSGTRARRNADNLTTVIETTETTIVISDLDPRIVYAVSVAARTSAGVSNYSQERIVGCKSL